MPTSQAIRETWEEDHKTVLKDLRKVCQVRSKDGESKEDFVAIESFSPNAKPVEFVSMVGPSGCGKTTLLDIMAGLAGASEGSILIDGKEMVGPALDRGIVMRRLIVAGSHAGHRGGIALMEDISRGFAGTA
jgi:ABC-type glutathione transport system ATPase component